MKKLRVPVIILIIFYVFIYFWNQEEKDIAAHPTIHNAAGKPDDYLLEVKEYEEQHLHQKSVRSIEKAIQAMWRLENDVDAEGFERLEQAIEKLEIAHRKILRDSISPSELLKILEYSLSNLAYVELHVAEKYQKLKEKPESNAALKYAQLHIKNTLALQSSIESANWQLISTETHLMEQIDSLFAIEDVNSPEYTHLMNKMLAEVDDIIMQLDSED